MKRLIELRSALQVLALIGAFALCAEAGMMDETRTGMLAGAKGHHAAGTVILDDGVLTLKEIKVDRVPDGRVYLAKGGDHRQGVELGKLKQFSGTLSYRLPQGVDSKAYDSVVIWCEKFSVEIGRAILAPEGM